MKLIYSFLSIMMIGLFTLSSCDNKKDNDVVTINEAQLEKEMNELEREFEEMGDKFKNGIANLENEIEESSDEAKAELEERKADMEKAYDDLKKRMNNLGQRTAANWEEFKKDTNQFFENLENSFEWDS